MRNIVVKGLLWAAVLAVSLIAAACSGHPADPSNATADEPAGRYDPNALPPGPVGQSIAYGHAIVVKTQWLMKSYVRSDMSCADCHVAGGTQPRGGSFVGTYGRFPQWNKRAHRVIALQDRIAECFLYSMNGKPPPYNSKAMIAIVAYIAWLSRGTAVGASPPPADRSLAHPAASPDVHHGAQLYSTVCETCHGVDGQGLSGFYPPLWGPRSFNNLAGMAHLDKMTGFVRYNMPANDPGTLTADEAYDVSGFVLSHKRPRFRWAARVTQPAEPARYF